MSNKGTEDLDRIMTIKNMMNTEINKMSKYRKDRLLRPLGPLFKIITSSLKILWEILCRDHHRPETFRWQLLILTIL